MNNYKTTPMIKQYLSIKEKHPDSVLLYRMGDFYEMFFDDAQIASQILDIVLTSRNKNNADSVPMCGFPYRSARTYIAKLIAHGHKVAICNQVGDTSKNKGKGLVERKVVQVITPGMLIDHDFLEGNCNNFILAFNYHKGVFGIAFLDISTGAFFVTESLQKNDIIDEIMRIQPSEFLIPKFLKNKSIYTIIEKAFPNSCMSFMGNDFFDYKVAFQLLSDQFKTLSLEGFGCDDMYSGVTAAGTLLKYVLEMQKQEMQHLKPIKTYSLNNFLVVDAQSCKNLELFDGIRFRSKGETLLNVLDNTVTSMGGRLLKNWMRYPLVDYTQILRRHNAVSELVDNSGVRRNIRSILNFISDLDRLISRFSLGSANAKDLNTLKESIQVIPELFKVVSVLESKIYSFPYVLDDLYKLAAFIHESIREDVPVITNEGGMIKRKFSSELDKLVDITKNARSWIVTLENEEKNLTGIHSLKVRYNKVFGYFIEVPKTRVDAIPKHYICKQTLVNTERYTTDKLKLFESEVLTAESQRNSLELEIFENIIMRVNRYKHDIQRLSDFLSVLDCITTFALVAHDNGYCRPIMNSEGVISIEAGRHPVVERLVGEERFIPNSLNMDNTNNQLLIVTGPNMAGKSTVLRQTALCVIMAQIGSFVPAKKADIPITDKIFTRIGALDNLAAGQSTFLVEMQETANILNSATENSLVIIDEIGRGTSTLDGLSIGWAIAEYLHDLDGVGVKSMLATHYHELTELEKYKSRVKNFNVTAKEINGNVIFMRKLVRGSASKSYGVEVAHLAGIPECVVERSKEILFLINNNNFNFNIVIDNKDTERNSYKGEKTGKSMIKINILQEHENIISMLQNANISEMTPIDALNYLNELQIKAKVSF